MKHGDVYLNKHGKPHAYIGKYTTLDGETNYVMEAMDGLTGGWLSYILDASFDSLWVKAKTEPEVEGQERMDI